MEELAGLCRVDVAGVEGVEGLLDEVEGMAVEELALFISAIHSICGRRGTRFSLAFWRGLSPGLRYAPASSETPPKNGSSVIFMPNALSHFCSVSVHF